jgi:hypothetical protein
MVGGRLSRGLLITCKQRAFAAAFSSCFIRRPGTGRLVARLPTSLTRRAQLTQRSSPVTTHRFAELFAGVVVLLWCGQFLFDFLHNLHSK